LVVVVVVLLLLLPPQLFLIQRGLPFRVCGFPTPVSVGVFALPTSPRPIAIAIAISIAIAIAAATLDLIVILTAHGSHVSAHTFYNIIHHHNTTATIPVHQRRAAVLLHLGARTRAVGGDVSRSFRTAGRGNMHMWS
jgi:hypothetical protein